MKNRLLGNIRGFDWTAGLTASLSIGCLVSTSEYNTHSDWILWSDCGESLMVLRRFLFGCLAVEYNL